MTHDAAGNPVTREFDADADGTIDELRWYFYAGGDLVRVDHDLDNDAELDLVVG